MKINEKLAEKLQLSNETIKSIQDIYEEIEYLISTSGKMDSSKISIGYKMEECEFELQKLWGFPLDRNFHRHYMKLNGCTCPKMDNKDGYGIIRYISGDCPFHSGM